MSMAAMNPMAGGPVGGMMMMNSGGPGTPSNDKSMEAQRAHLNTYIYEYFLKLGKFEVARMLVKDSSFEIRMKPSVKQSPGRRKDAEMNGVDGDNIDMDMDMKDELPDDLPRPHLPNEGQGQGFLLDWFCIFSDLFSAQRNKGDMTPARQYLVQTQNMQKLRENQQNQGGLQRPGMMGNPNQFAMRRNGMMNGNGVQKLTQSMTPAQMQQLASQQKLMQQQQIQREHPEGLDMNGRPGTPGDVDGGGSPSKRQRLDAPQFNGQMGPNGRVPGMPQQQMLMQAGFNPNMNPAQMRQNAAMQQKMQGQMGMGNAMMNMANSGSPMLGPLPDPQFANGMPIEMFSQGMRNPAMQGGPGGAQGGNHALQDYQMQLMLLEQQNKKRLMMARQEQDSIGKQPDGSFPNQGGMQPGMSPSGSRNGTSPNPLEQMKRGNPQLGGLPGSPGGVDAMQGRSPGMNFMGNGMQPDFNTAAMMMNKGEGFVGPGPGMQPPNAMNMGGMVRGQPGRPGQFPGGQPMVQNGSQGQPQPMGTPSQRNNEMPPPQAPAAGNVGAQRQAPPSPNQSQAPPTPSQSSKANPKKKAKEGDAKKKNTKKNSTANAPAESEAPATSTPSTPITPQHAVSFNNSGQKGGVPNPAANNIGPTSNPSVPQPPPQPDMQAGGFSGFDGSDPQFNLNLDFSTLDNTDVLENFDFDSFLNTGGAGDEFSFDQSLNVDSFGLDSVE